MVGWVEGVGCFHNQTLPRNELCLRWSFQGLKVLEGFVLVQNNHKTPQCMYVGVCMCVCVCVCVCVCGGGKTGGGGLVLYWHVVGMSLTSQGSGENKQASVSALRPRLRL